MTSHTSVAEPWPSVFPVHRGVSSLALVLVCISALTPLRSCSVVAAARVSHQQRTSLSVLAVVNNTSARLIQNPGKMPPRKLSQKKRRKKKQNKKEKKKKDEKVDEKTVPPVPDTARGGYTNQTGNYAGDGAFQNLGVTSFDAYNDIRRLSHMQRLEKISDSRSQQIPLPPEAITLRS